MTPANFGIDRFGGLSVARGQILGFSVGFRRRPYNTLALPCERVIARYWLEIATFSYPLAFNAPYGVASGTIAVNVTRLERGFNACKTPGCIYPSIFNCFPVIQAWSLKIRHFSTFFAHFGLPCVRPWVNRGKCHTVRKRIQCLQNASLYISIYLRPFPRNSSRKFEGSPF